MQLAQLLLSFSLVFAVHSYKILVYNSRYGHSHSNFLGNIADILADAGHDVTSLISIIDERGSDVTEKSKKIIVPRGEETEKLTSELASIRADFFFTDNLDPVGIFKNRKTFALHFVAQCRALLKETKLLENLRAEKFDVMIVENFDMCGVGLAHHLKPRALITSSASYQFSYQFEEFGIPLALSYNPSSFISHLNIHSLWSRLKNVYANWLMHVYFYHRRVLVEELYREKFGDDFPSLEEISSHAAYTLTNSEPLIDYATPTLNRVINIGGIGAKQPKKLSEEWNEVLSRRSQNILISFGSVARAQHLPKEIKKSIVTVISRFPDITFIWKYEEPADAFCNETTSSLFNVFFTPWMPQNDLLADDRITTFITHGGMGSTQETALRGKPGIFVPIFGDQPRNAGMMEFNGLGKVLDKFDMGNPDKVEAIIREVLTDKKYTDNSRRVSAMLAKKPFTARELLVKTVEFTAEFGPSKALRPQSYDMNVVEYHNIDIIAFSLLIMLIILYFTIRTSKWILTKSGLHSSADLSNSKAKTE